MSQFGHDPGNFPPPAPTSTQGAPPPSGPPPFGGYGSPPPPPGYVPAGYPPMYGAAYPPEKPPRPAVPVGSALLILGGVVMIVAPFLTWFTINHVNVDGYQNYLGQDSPDGAVFAFFGVLSIGFGITQLFARRVLAVAIIAVVFASFALLSAFGVISDINDKENLFSSIPYSMGIGPWIALLGTAIALAGAIATLSRRRRWPAPI